MFRPFILLSVFVVSSCNTLFDPSSVDIKSLNLDKYVVTYPSSSAQFSKINETYEETEMNMLAKTAEFAVSNSAAYFEILERDYSIRNNKPFAEWEIKLSNKPEGADKTLRYYNAADVLKNGPALESRTLNLESDT